MIVHYNFPHHCCTTLNLLRFCNQGQSTRYHCRLDTKNSNSATRKSFKKIAPHLVQVLKGVLTNLSVYYLAIKAYLELFMALWMWVWYPFKWGSNAVQNGNEIPTRLKMVGLLSTPGANNNRTLRHTRPWLAIGLVCNQFQIVRSFKRWFWLSNQHPAKMFDERSVAKQFYEFYFLLVSDVATNCFPFRNINFINCPKNWTKLVNSERK